MFSGSIIVRNATILGYPFRESVLSALPLCDEFIINCGDSEDNTRDICESLAREHSKIRIIHNTWERESQAGGFQIKKQTDLALAECLGTWCLVVQADEVLHEADYDAIRNAANMANNRPEVDGLLFDYLHFYGSHHYTISGRNWYRREVRAFKNQRGINAFRDAQGYRKDGKRPLVIPSGARVFHYGYVRTPESLKAKFLEMNQWWGGRESATSQDFSLYRHVGLQRFTKSHPAVMNERIRTYGDTFDPNCASRKWDANELKNALTVVWESLTGIRIGEYRNYELCRN